jgi:hypothetical protein
MMERNRNRASLASNNSMGLSDGGMKSSGLQLRQSIGSVGSDQMMNKLSKPALVNNDKL